jgi:hypothetical protein
MAGSFKNEARHERRFNQTLMLFFDTIGNCGLPWGRYTKNDEPKS